MPDVDASPVFRHEALFYNGIDDFVASAASFIRDSVEADEPILVVVSRIKIDLLRHALGPLGDSVRFADMSAVGTNPARIIPAWRAFIDEFGAGDQPIRGIGEPIFPERTADEIVECEHHEALLNLAFEGTNFLLLCPYDLSAFGSEVADRARHNHSHVRRGEAVTASDMFLYGNETPGLLEALLTPAPATPGLSFTGESFREVRALVATHAERAGLSRQAVDNLTIAVSEAVTNSVLHGGGRGVLQIWQTPQALVCEVRDAGRLSEPLAGRVKPTADQPDGRGLWIVNQVCDLVQLRSSASGTTLRMHMRLAS